MGFSRTSAILATTFSCMLLVGCASNTIKKLAPLDVQQLTTSYIDALNTGALSDDQDIFLDKWADVFEHTVSLATMRSREELRQFFVEWFDLFNNWTVREQRSIIQGNFVALEGVGQGLHRATGKPLQLPMVMIMQFNSSGKITMAHVYFDTRVILQQLGQPATAQLLRAKPAHASGRESSP